MTEHLGFDMTVDNSIRMKFKKKKIKLKNEEETMFIRDPLVPHCSGLNILTIFSSA